MKIPSEYFSLGPVFNCEEAHEHHSRSHEAPQSLVVIDAGVRPTRRNVPVAVLGGHTFIQISAAYEHTCALKASGEAWCWGANRFGQLGINNTVSRKQRPAKVVGGLVFAQSSSGGRQQRGTTCAVTTDDRAYCWGNGNLGERGDNTTGEKQFSPKAVVGTRAFHRITSGDHHTRAVTTGNQAWCWGSNVWGALGMARPRPRPGRVREGCSAGSPSPD